MPPISVRTRAWRDIRVLRSVTDRASVAAWCGYVALALACTWPLPLALSSRVTGPVSGDTGVYIWNTWLFRHEIQAHHRFPFFTGEILSLSDRVDLGLHNYTTFVDILAYPLIPLFGVTATFNLIYLLMIVLTGWTMFLLARSLTGRAAEAWIAGALFAASPVLIARGTGHFSLVAAMPLPLFAWAVIKTELTLERRYAAVAGLTIAWATLCDVYFGVFCVLLGAVYIGARWLRVQVRRGEFVRPPLLVLDLATLILFGLIAGIVITGGMNVHVRGRTVAMNTLYNPVLALILLLTIRAVLTLRPHVTMTTHPRVRILVGLAAVAALACVLPLSPVLYAIGYRLADGGSLQSRVLWRSSPQGADLLAFFVPNPNHALVGGVARDWIASLPNGFIENAVAVPFVALLVIAWAVWKHGFRPPAEWVAVSIVFGALSLGPFVHVGGVNTYVPGPWVLLRYVPIVGAARMPARFTIVLMLGVSLVFALALTHITARFPAARRRILVVVAAVLIFELIPAPRTLYSAEIPGVFKIIRDDPRDVRVLELPLGIRDGESSLGNFTAATQFHQTFHEKRIIGGYLSRISRKEKGRQRRFLMMRSLLRRSEGINARVFRPEIYRARGRAFLRRGRIGYVVIDVARAAPELRAFAIDSFNLELIQSADGYELYRPKEPRE
jgi:hypothetical protein